MMHPAAERTKGLVAVNLAAVIFGTSALYGKIDLSPFWIVGGRAFCAALVLSLLALWRKRSLPIRPRFWFGAGLSGLLLSAHWVTFFMTVQQGSVAIATLTFAAFPIFTVGLDALWRRQFLSWRALGCALMILLAVGILYDPAAMLAQQQAIGLGLGSAFLFALFGRISQDLGRDYAADWLSAGQNGLVFLSLVPFLGHFSPPVVDQWGLIFILGVVNTALMHQLYFLALRHLSATLTSSFLALEPIYAILFAAMLFGDPITPLLVCSAILILTASITILRYEQT